MSALVHALVHPHDRHGSVVVSPHRIAHWIGAAPRYRQKRGMHVDAAKPRSTRASTAAECGRRPRRWRRSEPNRRGPGVSSRRNFSGWKTDRHVARETFTGGACSPARVPPAVRLTDYADQAVGAVEQRVERRHGEFRRSEEDDAQRRLRSHHPLVSTSERRCAGAGARFTAETARTSVRHAGGPMKLDALIVSHETQHDVMHFLDDRLYDTTSSAPVADGRTLYVGCATTPARSRRLYGGGGACCQITLLGGEKLRAGVRTSFSRRRSGGSGRSEPSRCPATRTFPGAGLLCRFGSNHRLRRDCRRPPQRSSCQAAPRAAPGRAWSDARAAGWRAYMPTPEIGSSGTRPDLFLIAL